MSKPLCDLTDNSMKNLKDLVDVNTIVGTPITTPDGTTIIPVSKVTFGFATGGSDLPGNRPTEAFGGGQGGGVTIQPIAFVVVQDGRVDIKGIQTADNTADRVVNIVPQVIDQISALIDKVKEKKETPTAE